MLEDGGVVEMPNTSQMKNTRKCASYTVSPLEISRLLWWNTGKDVQNSEGGRDYRKETA